MPDVGFTNLLVVSLIALVAPLALGFVPRLRMPAVAVSYTHLTLPTNREV